MSAPKKQKLEQYQQQRLEHTPWVEKYRPKNLDDVASQDHAVNVLKKSLVSANLPHMLFYGPPGTGKTSTVLALARELYGQDLIKSRVLELNASDERGIAIVRQKVKNFARLTVSNASPEDLEKYPCPPYKLIILDEADSMTYDAQAALRRTMETYSGVTRFCLICNYITRIIDPLALRCSKFRFKPLANDNAVQRLRYIVQQEGLNVDEDVFSYLLAISNGDLRRAITYLQSAARLASATTDKTTISAATLREIAGVVPEDQLQTLYNTLEEKNVSAITSVVGDLVLQGWGAQQVLDQLHELYVHSDSIPTEIKNRAARLMFETDRRLNNGADEHLQLLNLCLQLVK